MDTVAIPTCYHPTTVTVIDDNHQYLQGLHLELDILSASYKLFNEPSQALDFLTNTYEPSSFINHCLQEDIAHDHRILDINIPSIYQEINNNKRFTEIATIVVDYVMPGINGLEICQRLKNKPFKRVLLTGEAQELNAIQGFNRGDINQYIRKDEIYFKKTINNIISHLQWQYFLDLSSLIVDYHSPNKQQLKVLTDTAFINFFTNMRVQTKNIEFYLLDKHGSFLLLDIQGNPTWLIVKNAKEMHSLYAYAVDEEAPLEVIDVLQNRTMLPYFHTEQDLQTSPADWGKFMHPAKELKGELDTYYYAVIGDTPLYKLNKDKILSYKDYLDTI